MFAIAYGIRVHKLNYYYCRNKLSIVESPNSIAMKKNKLLNSVLHNCVRSDRPEVLLAIIDVMLTKQ